MQAFYPHNHSGSTLKGHVHNLTWYVSYKNGHISTQLVKRLYKGCSALSFWAWQNIDRMNNIQGRLKSTYLINSSPTKSKHLPRIKNKIKIKKNPPPQQKKSVLFSPSFRLNMLGPSTLGAAGFCKNKEPLDPIRAAGSGMGQTEGMPRVDSSSLRKHCG